MNIEIYRCEKCGQEFYDKICYINHKQRKRKCVKHKKCKICFESYPENNFSDHLVICAKETLNEILELKNVIQEMRNKIEEAQDIIEHGEIIIILVWLIIHDISYRYLKNKDTNLLLEYQNSICFDKIHNITQLDKSFFDDKLLTFDDKAKLHKLMEKNEKERKEFEKIFFFIYGKHYDKIHEYYINKYNQKNKPIKIFHNVDKIRQEFKKLYYENKINDDILKDLGFRNYEKKIIKCYLNCVNMLKNVTYFSKVKYDFDIKRYRELFGIILKCKQKKNNIIKQLKDNNYLDILKKYTLEMTNLFKKIHNIEQVINLDMYNEIISFLEQNSIKSYLFNNNEIYNNFNTIYYDINYNIDYIGTVDIYLVDISNKQINEYFILLNNNKNFKIEYYGFQMGVHVIIGKTINDILKIIKKVNNSYPEIIYTSQKIFDKKIKTISKKIIDFNDKIKEHNNMIKNIYINKKIINKELNKIIKQYDEKSSKTL